MLAPVLLGPAPSADGPAPPVSGMDASWENAACGGCVSFSPNRKELERLAMRSNMGAQCKRLQCLCEVQMPII